MIGCVVLDGMGVMSKQFKEQKLLVGYVVAAVKSELSSGIPEYERCS